MSTTTTDPTAEGTDRLAVLREQAIAVKILSELVKKADANVRAALLEELLDEHRTTGRKTFDATAFGLTGIGTITLPDPGEDKAVVEDTEAFLDWVEENHPDQVRTVYLPDPEWQKAFLSSLAITEAGVINPLTEQVIPGVGVKAAPAEPTKFNVNLSKTTIGEVTSRVLGRTVAALTEAASTTAAIEAKQ